MFKLKKNQVAPLVLMGFIALGFFVTAKVKVSSPKPKKIAAATMPAAETEKLPRRIFSEPRKRPVPTPVTISAKAKTEAIKKVVQKKSQKRKAKISKRKLSPQKKAKIKRSISTELRAQIEQGLAEGPQGNVFDIDPYMSEALLDHRFAFDAIFPRELPVNIHEGVVVALDWKEQRKELLKAYAKAPELSKPVVLLNEPVLVAKSNSPIGSAPTTEAPKNQLVPMKAAASSDFEKLFNRGKNILGKVQEKLNPTSQATAPPPPPVNTQNPPRRNPNKSPVPGVEPAARNILEPVGKLYGKLTLDRATERWLDSQKGHVELRLVKSDSRDPQDQVFVDYEYPSREFFWDGSQVKGQYKLLAQFFAPDKPVTLAEVEYSQPINEATARQMAVFHIQKTAIDEAVRTAKSENHEVALSGTVFEANTADPYNEKPIGGAAISVNGFSEWGIFHADSSGFFRIPKVTAQSEFVLSVSAPGYYPTQVTVPVSKTAGYVSVHLVPQKTVETVTQFFTKRPQSPEKALVFGRLFNPATKEPAADQEASLVGRTGHALYFGALPDVKLTQTTSTGAFAFFNVDPALRSVGKVGSGGFQLFSAIPGHAYYVESGRAGSRSLKGQIIDPYRNQKVMGVVKVVGSPTQVETNSLGEFVIENIELAPGILTLEVEAEGYPLSWHTLSWNPRLSYQKQMLYMPEADLLNESRESIARVSEAPHTGSIFGGAEKGFFENQKGCVEVTLEDGQGRALSKEKGPYPLYSDSLFESTQKLCLYSSRPGFSFYNLPAGQYLLKWKTSKGELLRSHVIRVGRERVSIVVN